MASYFTLDTRDGTVGVGQDLSFQSNPFYEASTIYMLRLDKDLTYCHCFTLDNIMSLELI